MSECSHDQFKVDIEPCIWQDMEGEMLARGIRMKVTCESCGAPFRFRSFPIDDTAMNPVMTLQGDEVKIPLDDPWVEAPEEKKIELIN